MDKYDQAIEFLKDHAPGSYYDECAALMEELLAQVHEANPERTELTDAHLARLKQMDAGARYYAKVRNLM